MTTAVLGFAQAARDLVEDLDVYAYRKQWPKWMCIFTPLVYPTTWPVVHYRFSHWVWQYVRIPVIRQVLMAVNGVVGRALTMMTGAEIAVQSSIGPGLFLAHMGTIIIAMDTKIGAHASIHQEVTFGGAGRNSGCGGFPVLGDDVYVGAGAKIIGSVRIGNNVMIGCNAVVTRDVPDEATAVGLPARVVNYKGSHGAIHYRKPSGC